MAKRIFFPLILIIGLLAGVYLAEKYFSWRETKVQEQSHVLLERIKAVSKLITVEGYFSEVYSHKEYLGWDIPGLRKSALVRVQAKVSVGFDLNEMNITMRPDRKEVIISHLPEPEILSIDHELDYYDIKEGTFFPFTEADHNKIQKRAKNLIRQKVAASGLYDEANDQAVEMINTLEFLSESTGWTLRYKEGIHLVSPDSIWVN